MEADMEQIRGRGRRPVASWAGALMRRRQDSRRGTTAVLVVPNTAEFEGKAQLSASEFYA